MDNSQKSGCSCDDWDKILKKHFFDVSYASEQFIRVLACEINDCFSWFRNLVFISTCIANGTPPVDNDKIALKDGGNQYSRACSLIDYRIQLFLFPVKDVSSVHSLINQNFLSRKLATYRFDVAWEEYQARLLNALKMRFPMLNKEGLLDMGVKHGVVMKVKAVTKYLKAYFRVIHWYIHTVNGFPDPDGSSSEFFYNEDSVRFRYLEFINKMEIFLNTFLTGIEKTELVLQSHYNKELDLFLKQRKQSFSSKFDISEHPVEHTEMFFVVTEDEEKNRRLFRNHFIKPYWMDTFSNQVVYRCIDFTQIDNLEPFESDAFFDTFLQEIGSGQLAHEIIYPFTLKGFSKMLSSHLDAIGRYFDVHIKWDESLITSMVRRKESTTKIYYRDYDEFGKPEKKFKTIMITTKRKKHSQRVPAKIFVQNLLSAMSGVPTLPLPVQHFLKFIISKTLSTRQKLNHVQGAETNIASTEWYYSRYTELTDRTMSEVFSFLFEHDTTTAEEDSNMIPYSTLVGIIEQEIEELGSACGLDATANGDNAAAADAGSDATTTDTSDAASDTTTDTTTDRNNAMSDSMSDTTDGADESESEVASESELERMVEKFQELLQNPNNIPDAEWKKELLEEFSVKIDTMRTTANSFQPSCSVNNNNTSKLAKCVEGYASKLAEMLNTKQWTINPEKASEVQLVSAELQKGCEIDFKSFYSEETGLCLGCALLLNGRFISDTFLQSILKTLNDSTPMHETSDVLQKTTVSCIGLYSNRKSFYSYQKGKTFIESQPLVGSLTPILHLMNVQLLGDFYEHLKNNKLNIFKVEQDALQVLVSKNGSGFGWHSDANPTNSVVTTRRQFKQAKLPFESEMLVITLVICVDQDNKIVEDSQCRCKVTWKPKNSANDSTSWFLQTGGMSMHIQMPPVQSTCEHQVKQNFKDNGQQFTRIVISSRYPKSEAPVQIQRYKRYTNCLKYVNGLEQLSSPVSEDSHQVNLPEKGDRKLGNKAVAGFKKKCNISVDKESIALLSRPPVNMRVPAKISHLALRSEPAFMQFMNHEKSLEIHDEERFESKSYFNKLGCIGDIGKSKDVRARFNLQSDGVVGVFSNKIADAKAICLEEPYKNLVEGKGGIREYAQLVYTHRNNNKKLLESINKFPKDHFQFRIGGSGGSYQVDGVFPQKIDQSQNDVIAKSAFPTDISPTLLSLIQNRVVVELFVPREWAESSDKKLKKGKSEELINLGLVAGVKLYVGQIPDAKFLTDTYGDLGTWSTCPNPIYTFAPIFNSSNPLPVDYSKIFKAMEKSNPFRVGKHEVVKVPILRSERKPKSFEEFVSRLPNVVTADWIAKNLQTDDSKDVAVVGETLDETELLSTHQMVIQTIRLCAASFGRLLSLNKTPNGLSFLPLEGIGMVSGIYAIPSPIRTYQIPVFLILNAFGTKADGMYPRKQRGVVESKTSLLYTILSIIVVRTTGNIILFNMFSQFFKLGMEKMTTADNQDLELPKDSDRWSSFISFLCEFIGADTKINEYVSVLYSNAVPDLCNGTVNEYVKFIKALKTALERHLDNGCLKNWKKKGFDYKKWIAILRDLFLNNGYASPPVSAPAHCSFLASIVLSDLNELYQDAIVNVEGHAVYGPYAQDGIKLLQNQASSTPTIQSVTDLLVEEMKNCNQNVLSIMGLRKTKDGKILISLTDREVGPLDTENILCKLAVAKRRAGSAFSASANIDMKRQIYEWPLRFEVNSMAPFEKIAQQSLTNFLKLCDSSPGFAEFSNRNIFQYAEVVLGGNSWSESEKWKASCGVILKEENHPMNELRKKLNLTQGPALKRSRSRADNCPIVTPIKKRKSNRHQEDGGRPPSPVPSFRSMRSATNS